MMIKKKLSVRMLVYAIFAIPFLGMVLFPPALCALEISEVMVTDVTPASFCVVWLAHGAASCSLELFQDEEGLFPVASYNIIQTPCTTEEIFTRTAQKGIFKIKVDGLSKATTYYFKLSCTSTTGVTDPDCLIIYPSKGSLPGVTTGQEAHLSKTDEHGAPEIRLQSNFLVADFLLEDKSTPAEHSLVVASLGGASYPISAYPDEGVSSPSCVFDLHNLFDQIENKSFEVSEGGEIIFYHYKGVEQTAIRKFSLPQVFPDAEPVSPVGLCQRLILSKGLNYFSFQVDPQNSEQIHAALHGKFSELWTFKEGAWIDLTGNDSYLFFPNQGYLIITTELIEVAAVGGWRMDPIPLKEGLNILGYRSEVPASIDEVMAPLVGKYRRIWGYSEGNWQSYDPTLPAVLNTLTEIVPGRSYYLDMKEDGAKW